MKSKLFLIALLVSLSLFIQSAPCNENIGGRFGVGPRYISFTEDSYLSFKNTIGGNIFFTIPIKKDLGPISMIGIENAATFFKADAEEVEGYTRCFSIGQKVVIEKQFFRTDVDDYRMAVHCGGGYMYHVIRDFNAGGDLETALENVSGYIDMRNSWGMVGSVGLDYYIWSTGLLRLNLEYNTAKSSVYLRNPSTTIKAGEADLTNISLTLTIGFRF